MAIEAAAQLSEKCNSFARHLCLKTLNEAETSSSDADKGYPKSTFFVLITNA